jgi:hypothetical protein
MCRLCQEFSIALFGIDFCSSCGCIKNPDNHLTIVWQKLPGIYRNRSLMWHVILTVTSSFIQQIRSPSHPIAVSLGTTSVAPQANPSSSKASATLSLGSAELDKDFVIQVVAKDTGNPKAILEAHPTIAGQRALMATLVPKFSLPPERPEIVFVCDRSGSMMGSKIDALRNALKVFLKSLPVGVKFNICSFGSNYSFLWSKSKSYSQASLQEAMVHVEKFDANFGGTEMVKPIEATLKQRYKDMSLEVFLVTDGEIWDQQQLFSLLNKEIGEKKAPIRVFTLGIGDDFSSSLVEGVARAGNGFSQAVGENENCAGKVVRMLKGALSPHVTDYTLEVKYGGKENDDFEIIEKVTDSLKVNLTISKDKASAVSEKVKMKPFHSISVICCVLCLSFLHVRLTRFPNGRHSGNSVIW